MWTSQNISTFCSTSPKSRCSAVYSAVHFHISTYQYIAVSLATLIMITCQFYFKRSSEFPFRWIWTDRNWNFLWQGTEYWFHPWMVINPSEAARSYLRIYKKGWMGTTFWLFFFRVLQGSQCYSHWNSGFSGPLCLKSGFSRFSGSGRYPHTSWND